MDNFTSRAGHPDPVAEVLQADLRATIDAVPVLISFYGTDHVCRLANEYHCRWYGMDPVEIVGKHFRDLLGEAGYQKRLPYLERVAAGEAVMFDAQVPHLDGSWHDAAIRYIPRTNAAGVDGFYVPVFDISLHEYRFRSLFEGASSGYCELDLSRVAEILAQAPNGAGVKRKRLEDPGILRLLLDAIPLVRLNDRACSILGIERQDATGIPVGRWCRSATEPAMTALLSAFIDRAPGCEVETILYRMDGSTADVLLTCTIPNMHDPAAGLLTVALIDIGQRKLRELELAQAQGDLVHAARVSMLGEMTASIAHEVNQPLAAIMANGNAALRWLRRPVPQFAEATVAIERLIGEAARASGIISGLRDLARKGSGDRGRLAPNPLIHEVMVLVERELGAQGAQVRLDLAKRLPDVRADRVQLQQVLINLLMNAAQAMQGQPRASRQIVVRTGFQEGSVRFEVRDHGPGIGAEDAGRLFTAFFTTKQHGMGLGLSVARTIVEAHEGSIGLLPVEGGGACVCFDIPALPGEPD